MLLSRGDRELGVTLQTHPGSQSSYQGVAKNSALLSSHDGYLLEPTERPKGSQASSGVWREDSGLLIRPCRKRRPSSRDDGGVSWVFLNCSASVGFLARYDGELRERLVWRRGSQVSLWLARRCASLLSSHGRGVRPPLRFGEKTQDCSPGHAGKEGPQLARTWASQGFIKLNITVANRRGMILVTGPASVYVLWWANTVIRG